MVGEELKEQICTRIPGLYVVGKKSKKQIYKQIDKLYEKLVSLGVAVSGDYRSKLPSVNIVTGSPRYEIKENAMCINPIDKNNEELKDDIAEESMHFLDYATQGRIRSDVKTPPEYLYIDEFVGAFGILLEGTSEDGKLRKKIDGFYPKLEKYETPVKDTEYIYKFLFDTVMNKRPHEKLVEEYENNDIFEKYLRSFYKPIKKLIETPEDERSIEDKKRLINFYTTVERVYLEEFKELDELKKEVRSLESHYHRSNQEKSFIVAHKKGYDLAQKVYETDGGIKGFFEKYPNFLLQSYEQKDENIESF